MWRETLINRHIIKDFMPIFMVGVYLMETTTETWEHRSIMTNGIRMHYVIQGHGPLILLLHGFPEFWYSWRHQIPFLAELGYTVVTPDLRGYNDTDKPHTGYDIANLLRDIVGLIQGLEYEKVVTVGHDWGGTLAWAFAQNYPQFIESLIVMNAPHPAAMQRELRTLRQLLKSWYVLFFQVPWLPEYILGRNHAKAVGNLIYQAAIQKEAFPPDVLMHYRDAMSKPLALQSALAYYRTFFYNIFKAREGEPANTSILAPTLLIWGEQDVALDIALTQGLEQWVIDLRVKRISDSGHWVQEEKATLINSYLKEFLQKESTNL